LHLKPETRGFGLSLVIPGLLQLKNPLGEQSAGATTHDTAAVSAKALRLLLGLRLRRSQGALTKKNVESDVHLPDSR
jgi:hypothetical protein